MTEPKHFETIVMSGIHQVVKRMIGDMLSLNPGDWGEPMTLPAEDYAGCWTIPPL